MQRRRNTITKAIAGYSQAEIRLASSVALIVMARGDAWGGHQQRSLRKRALSALKEIQAFNTKKLSTKVSARVADLAVAIMYEVD
jgi:hypothetical protein